MRRAEEIKTQLLADLKASGLSEPLTAEQRLLVTYCIYWWVAFAKGYITEVAIFQDLTRSGIVFQAHDLSRFSERFSQDDLTVSGMRGDIKSSTYFLHSARHFPLKHDFYIAALYDPQQKQQRHVVIMQPDAWDKIDGDPLVAELEQAEVIAAFGSPGFHDLAPDVFFTALAAIDEEQPRETLEFSATIIDGQLHFLEPAPLHAHGNEIQVGDKRLVIKLVPEIVSAAA